MSSLESAEVVEPEALFEESLELSRDLVNFRELPEGSPLPRAERQARDMALLSVRLVALCLDQAGLDTFVSDHVATLLAASTRAGIVLYAQFVSEPMIAAAALVEMTQGNRMERILRSLLEALESGGVGVIFSAGDAGEFVATTMLLLAYDRVIRQMIPNSAPMTYIGAPISVGAFLEGLLGRAQFAKALVAGSGELLDSFASVLQAIPIVGKVTRERMLLAFRRRCAIICEKGEHGVDIVIPIVLPGRREKFIETLKATDISGIFVQVKNWRKSSISQGRIDKIFGKIEKFAKGLVLGSQYVALLMSVGAESISGEGRSLCRYNGRSLRLVLSGISSHTSQCLTEGVASCLQEIVKRGSRQDAIRLSNIEADQGPPVEDVIRIHGEVQLVTLWEEVLNRPIRTSARPLTRRRRPTRLALERARQARRARLQSSSSSSSP